MSKNYKGCLKGFPNEIVDLMLYRQVEQGNSRDVTVFENDITATGNVGGFSWNQTQEEFNFWSDVLRSKMFDVFFEKYPRTSSTIKFPCVMEVSNDPTFPPNYTYEKEVVSVIEGKYVTRSLEDSNWLWTWNYARIPENITIKLTRKEICEKFGISEFEIVD